MKVSPTQINTERECTRKFGFIYVGGQRGEQTPAMAFGTEGHTLQEDWLRNGVYPPETDVGLVARQGIKDGWLPTPSPDLIIEEKMFLELENGITLYGLADCIVPPVMGLPVVIDHKFTSAAKWAKTKEQLRTDPQAVFYSAWTRKRFGTQKALARWIYYVGTKPKGGERPRKPGGALKVQRVMEHDPKVWDALLRTVDRIVHIRGNKIDPMQLPKNTDACDNYGGCPFKRQCMKQSGRFFPSHKPKTEGEREMGLADKMAGGATTINPPKDSGDALENKLREALGTTAEPVEEVADKKTTKSKAKKKANGKKKTDALIVLQGALPNKESDALGEVHQLVDILAPLMREVAVENEVAHYGLIDFAKGPKFLAVKLDKLWAAEKPSGVIIADYSSDAQAVQSVLTAYADVVIHGVR